MKSSYVMRSLLVFFLLALTGGMATGQDVLGFWNGEADMMGQSLRVEFVIEGEMDHLSGEFKSPDQSEKALPITDGYFRNDSLVLKVDDISLSFEGKFIPELGSFGGFMKQSGMTYPIILQREALAPEKPERTQIPTPPFPYSMINATFENAEAGIKLAGTQYIPYDETKAVVVLVSGSGPQDRNSELLDHQPFKIWADHLGRNGIATFRYDERGVGESEGNFSTSTSHDFAADALEAVRWIKEQDDFKGLPVGIMGHSEGGLIAALVASSSDEVDFIISLAGLGVSGKEVLITQSADASLAEGLSLEFAIEQQDLMKGYVQVIEESEGDILAIRNGLDAFLAENFKENNGLTLPQMQEIIGNQFTSPWMIAFVGIDARKLYEKVTCPVLAINGDKDVQVDFGNNLRAIEFATRRAGNEDVTTVTLENHNHLLQETENGAASLYGKITQTVSPKAMDVVTNWINLHYAKQ